MTQGGRSDDAAAQFEQELRELIARFDPVPDDVRAEARRAGRVQPPADSELLELVYDSVLDADVREVSGETPVRALAFGGSGIRLEVRVDSDDDGPSRLTAFAIPVAPTAATLRTEEAAVRLPVAPDGAFCCSNLARAPVRLEIELLLAGETRHFHSGWFVL